MRFTQADIQRMNPKAQAQVKAALATVGASPLEKRVQAAVRPAEMIPKNPTGKTCCIITLPHPDKALSPNGRPGRWGKVKAIKDARLAATFACYNQQPNFVPMWKAVTIETCYYSTTKRHPDEINLLSSLKAAEDGICDAGIIKNDNGCKWLPVVWLVDKHAPRIELKITEVKK